MCNNLDQSIMDVPTRRNGHARADQVDRGGACPFACQIKYVDGLGAYTNLMRVMQTLDEEIGRAIRQDRLWENLLHPAMRPDNPAQMVFNVPG